MVKLILWEMDHSFFPPEPEERMKLTMTLCEMVKKSMDDGKMKMWGMNPGGNTVLLSLMKTRRSSLQGMHSIFLTSSSRLSQCSP